MSANSEFLTAQQIAENERRIDANLQAWEQELRDHSLSIAQAAAFTGHPERRISLLVATDRAIVHFTQEDEVLLPRWQFRANPFSPIIPEALEAAQEFYGATLALNHWMLKPHSELHGFTPAQALQDEEQSYMVPHLACVTSARYPAADRNQE